MRQTLFYIPEKIAGVPVFGLGWLLLAWVLLVVGWLVWHRLQRRPSAEISGLLMFAVTVALAVLFVFPMLETEGLGLPIRGYGVMLLLAVVLGVATATHRARQVGVDPEQVYSLAFWMFALGIAGARLFYVIQFWETFPRSNSLQTFSAILKFTEGGLVVYGSLIGATLAFVLYAWRKRISIFRLADVIAPSLVLGLAIGRIGCLLNGCCYGGVCDEGPIGIRFPRFSAPEAELLSPAYRHQLALGRHHGLRLAADGQDGSLTIVEVAPQSPASEAGIEAGTKVRSINGVQRLNDLGPLLAAAGEQFQLTTAGGRTFQLKLAQLPEWSLPSHPAQLYAAINGLLIFCVAWYFFPFRRREGEVFGLVLTVYPVTRILLEWVRADEIGQWGTPLTISQLISLLILLLMLVYWAILRSRPRLAAAGS